MKDRLKEIYRTISQKHPMIGYWLWRCYHKKPFNWTRKSIKGKNNVLTCQGSILSSVKFDIVGSNNEINIKRSCILNSVTFYLRGDHLSVTIGEDCRFFRGSLLWLEDSGGCLEIGDKCTFEDAHLAVTEPGLKISIGRDCMFAYDIDVRTGDSHSILDAESKERINYGKNVAIGDHVWVAAHCSILKGVTIANNSIVAAGSIVTKSVAQQGVILAGNPARMVKEGITWSRQRIYR